ncbi:MAG: alanine--tRNA ligase-related protein [bacterium]|nr:alanine--tRNA ligase-related protein [bacterium]
MTSREIREKFITFFQKEGHREMPPSSLISDDPTTLFTTAGMQRFKRHYVNPEEAPASRLVTIQPCFRTSDIEEVGDSTHLTFFEMLGNFSFGYPTLPSSYFKKEAIDFAWRFLTEELKIDKSRIYATYFQGDNMVDEDHESKQILETYLEKGLTKIVAQGFEDNFWSLGTEGSPGGPTVEFYVSPRANKRGDESRGDGVEVWNLVFNEYIFKKGNYQPSKHKGVDTGMGLERLAVMMQDKDDVFQTDLFTPIIAKIEELTGKKYQDNTKAFRIIVDHLRSSCFLLAEDMTPSNIGQGYILRRLIRRAIRYGWMLDLKKRDQQQILNSILLQYNDIYSALKQEQKITQSFLEEEKKFQQTIQIGLKKAAFILEKKKPLPDDIYAKIMQLPKREETLHRLHIAEPSDELDPELQKIGIQITNREFHNAFITGEEAFNLFQTYGFPIEIITELAQEKRLFVGVTAFQKELKKHQEVSRVGAGMFKGGLQETGEQEVKYHTATHLLHAALREVLGEHVQQKGSNITAERLRFDFSHPEKMTLEQIKKVEGLVNEKIKDDLAVRKEEMTLEEAKKRGALAFFTQKYGDKVCVYTISDEKPYSMEVCGGPHVERTGKLGHFKITKEEASSAGIRRIKAVLE